VQGSGDLELGLASREAVGQLIWAFNFFSYLHGVVHLHDVVIVQPLAVVLHDVFDDVSEVLVRERQYVLVDELVHRRRRQITRLVLVVGCWLLVVGYWLLVVGCWLLVIGCWLLVIGCWLLVVGCWLLVVGC
jgi:hypothetical protein